MHINTIDIKNLGNLQNAFFALHRGFNLIRGENGAGKTTLLEACSLLGHTCAIPHFAFIPERTNSIIIIDFEINDSEVQFLKKMVQQPIFGRRANSYFLDIFKNRLSGCGVDYKLFHSWKDALDERLRSEEHSTFKVTFFQAESSANLKSDLTSDEKLSRNWKILSQNNGAGVLALYLLTIWMRPFADDTGSLNTPRNFWALETDGEDGKQCRVNDTLFFDPDATDVPGIVTYFNTDMYDFGTGLDIRESPKFNDENLKRLLKRLQITDTDHNLLEKEKQEETLFKILGIASVSADQRARISSFLSELNSNQVRALSSGENQAFHLSLVLECFSAAGSIYLMDEADLHLSPLAAQKLYQVLRDYADTRGDQILLSTHGVATFRNELLDWNESKKKWGDGNGKVALTYIGSDGQPTCGHNACKMIDISYLQEIELNRAHYEELEDSYLISPWHLFSSRRSEKETYPLSPKRTCKRSFSLFGFDISISRSGDKDA